MLINDAQHDWTIRVQNLRFGTVKAKYYLLLTLKNNEHMWRNINISHFKKKGFCIVFNFEKVQTIIQIKSKKWYVSEKIKINHTPSTRLEQWKAQLNSTTPRIRDSSAPATVQRYFYLFFWETWIVVVAYSYIFQLNHQTSNHST